MIDLFNSLTRHSISLCSFRIRSERLMCHFQKINLMIWVKSSCSSLQCLLGKLSEIYYIYDRLLLWCIFLNLFYYRIFNNRSFYYRCFLFFYLCCFSSLLILSHFLIKCLKIKYLYILYVCLKFHNIILDNL